MVWIWGLFVVGAGTVDTIGAVMVVVVCGGGGFTLGKLRTILSTLACKLIFLWSPLDANSASHDGH